MTSLIRNPCWKTGPVICPTAWLPAFASERELREFTERNGPRVQVDRVYRCEQCGHWHAETTAASPSGDSSGTTRGKKGDA